MLHSLKNVHDDVCDVVLQQLLERAQRLRDHLWEQHQVLEQKLREAAKPIDEEMVKRGNDALEVGMNSIMNAIPHAPQFYDQESFAVAMEERMRDLVETKRAKVGTAVKKVGICWQTNVTNDVFHDMHSIDLSSWQENMVSSACSMVDVSEKSTLDLIKQEVNEQARVVQDSLSERIEELIRTLGSGKQEKEHSNKNNTARHVELKMHTECLVRLERRLARARRAASNKFEAAN